MKVFIHLQINNTGEKTDRGCVAEYQTKAAALEALREIQRDALRRNYDSVFTSSSCEYLRVSDPHPNCKWYFWEYQIKRVNPKKQK